MSKKATRQEQILSALEANPAMRSAALAQILDVSQETVRRDLAELEAHGQLQRTYGGAVRTRSSEPGLVERLGFYEAERQMIADLAVDLIGNADSLYIGGGATTLHFARALRATTRRITVITAAFNIATELAANPLIEVMSLPGIVEPNEGLVYGSATVKAIQSMQTGLAIVGASGIGTEGPSEALLQAAEVYSAMIENADKALVLADHSKFERRFLRVISDWSSSVSLVADRQPGESLGSAIRDSGGDIFCPE